MTRPCKKLNLKTIQMKKLIILTITMGIVTSCSNDDLIKDVNLRLSNVTTSDFENIIVDTGTGRVRFENLNSGEISEYQNFTQAYRYAYIELDVDGETYTLQPIDYVGETLLDDGNYTYELDLVDYGNDNIGLNINFVEE